MALSLRKGHGQQRRLPLSGDVMHTRELNARAEGFPCRLMQARGERTRHAWAHTAVAAKVEAP